MIRKLLIVLALLAALPAGGTVLADPYNSFRPRAQPNAEPNAGYVPLSAILQQINRHQRGEAVDIKFNRGVYRILWRRPDGRLQSYLADARTGQIRQGR